jgi:hypothetical protein
LDFAGSAGLACKGFAGGFLAGAAGFFVSVLAAAGFVAALVVLPMLIALPGFGTGATAMPVHETGI